MHVARLAASGFFIDFRGGRRTLRAVSVLDRALMKSSDSDRFSDGEWEDPGELAWSEYDWESYLQAQDDALHRYLGFYEKLRLHPNRIDEAARLMGWDAAEWRDTEAADDDEEDEEEETTPGEGDFDPYTLHKNPVFIATKAIFLSLTRAWQWIATDSAKVPQPLALNFLLSLHRGEQDAVLAIQALDLGDYTVAVSLFKRALCELNTTLALIDDKAAAHHRALADFRETALPRLFDLREIWLRVIGECREAIARQPEDADDDDA
jgi:hypothetical protein